jgi:hypothetical protein
LDGTALDFVFFAKASGCVEGRAQGALKGKGKTKAINISMYVPFLKSGAPVFFLKKYA